MFPGPVMFHKPRQGLHGPDRYNRIGQSGCRHSSSSYNSTSSLSSISTSGQGKPAESSQRPKNPDRRSSRYSSGSGGYVNVLRAGGPSESQYLGQHYRASTARSESFHTGIQSPRHSVRNESRAEDGFETLSRVTSAKGWSLRRFFKLG